MKRFRKCIAFSMALAICSAAFFAPTGISGENTDLTVYAETTLSDLPDDYQYAADWIWNNRILGESSVEAWDTIYDQIVAGDGTLNYVVKWHSYDSITLEQRQNLQEVLEDAVNEWTDWLVGYDEWPFEHVDVEITGWAVLDESCLIDRQDYETVYTDTVVYDSSYDISAGMGDSTIPTVEPEIPSELFRYYHWADADYAYPGGYENRIDMFLQATQGFIDVGGYGYYWGQQLSDNAVLGLCDGTTSSHILKHEMGHGFGLTDFYGEEGESDGFPPGGFPDDGTSIMMAGSSTEITDFDGWFLRYVWSQIKDESGRFDLSGYSQTTTDTEVTTTPEVTETTEDTEVTTTPEVTETTAETSYTQEEQGSGLTVTYYSNNNYWIIDTQGYHSITVDVQGLPYAALSGIYGYWDNNKSEWISGNWTISEGLDENGTSTFVIEIPEDVDTSEIQIQVVYYAQWSNEENDMIDKSTEDLVFSAFGDGMEVVSSTTSVTDVSDTTEFPDVTYIAGDVSDDGIFNVADIVMMKRFLISDGTLNNSNAGDVCKDGVINVMDLCAMKNMLIGNSN